MKACRNSSADDRSLTDNQPDMDRACRDREMGPKLRERALFQEILKALYWLETGRMGICEDCGEQIGRRD